MLNEFRPLTIKADGKQIAEDLRVFIQGSKNMTLLSDFFLFDIYNLGNIDLTTINDSKMLYAYGKEGDLVCCGEIGEIYTRADNTNVITTISVIDGKSFWESRVNKSFGGGAAISEAFRGLVTNAFVGAFTANDTRLIRGQTYDGRAADCISMLAKSVNARGYVTNNTVYITAKGKSPEVVEIRESDIIDNRNNGTGMRIIKTEVKGYPVGALVSLYGRKYRLISQKINADNYKGLWESLLVLVDEEALPANGMVGG